MRAPLVLLAALCGAMFLTGACQSESDRQQRDASVETADAHSTDSPDTGTAGTGATSGTPGPSTSETHRVFDHEAMASAVQRVLADDYDVDGLGRVTCPEGEEVVDGNTFHCDVFIDGDEQPVEITARGDDGKYIVAAPD